MYYKGLVETRGIKMTSNLSNYFINVLGSYYCEQVPKWDNLVVCLQMFIVRNLIIVHTQNHHIYTQTERRGNRLGARETERESVCERQSSAENRVGICCKNSRWEVANYFGIILGSWRKDYVAMRNYFNGRERFAKIH